MSQRDRWMSVGGSSREPNMPTIYVVPNQSNTFVQTPLRVPESQQAPPEYCDNQLPKYEDLFPAKTENTPADENHM